MAFEALQMVNSSRRPRERSSRTLERKEQWAQFLQWERASRDTIDVKRCYVDIAGDLVAGVMLSQIIYWHLPNKDNISRLTVERDGRMWLAKKREEWWDECRVTAKQADRALALLEELGLIETAVWHFHHIPCKHIALNLEAFLDAMATQRGHV